MVFPCLAKKTSVPVRELPGRDVLLVRADNKGDLREFFFKRFDISHERQSALTQLVKWIASTRTP